MEDLNKLEALGIALINVIRDTRYSKELRVTLRSAYDRVEEAVSRIQSDVTCRLPEKPDM